MNKQTLGATDTRGMLFYTFSFPFEKSRLSFTRILNVSCRRFDISVSVYVCACETERQKKNGKG